MAETPKEEIVKEVNPLKDLSAWVAFLKAVGAGIDILYQMLNESKIIKAQEEAALAEDAKKRAVEKVSILENEKDKAEAQKEVTRLEGELKSIDEKLAKLKEKKAALSGKVLKGIPINTLFVKKEDPK